jgi:transketolase
VFADFGVFALDEVYNQHRLNDINGTSLKVVGTHLGLNVGEDGKTHQAVDYLGLTRCLPGFRTVIPADPNQTDRVVRHVLSQPGNWFIGMGRSTVPVLTNEAGNPFFGPDYRFVFGKADLLRDGDSAAILTYGSVVGRAVAAWERLKSEGVAVQVWNLSCPNDPDPEALAAAASTGRIVTFEDHLCATGLSAVVSRELLLRGLTARLACHGLSDYAPSGEFTEVYDVVGLSVDGLVASVRRLLAGG